jgi:Flp pilus assembly pilin Flp
LPDRAKIRAPEAHSAASTGIWDKVGSQAVIFYWGLKSGGVLKSDFGSAKRMLKRIAAISFKNLRPLARDAAGGQVLEYAVVLGLIAVLSIGTMAKFGGNVFGHWSTVNNGIDPHKQVSNVHYIIVGADTRPSDTVAIDNAPATRPSNLVTADNSNSMN